MANPIASRTNGRVALPPPSPTPAPRRNVWLPNLPQFVRSMFFMGDGPLPEIIPTTPPAQAQVPVPAAPSTSAGVAVGAAAQAQRPAGPRPLSRGDTGPKVRELQTLLRDNGVYRGQITGTFDAATERALIDFQSDYTGPDGATIEDTGDADEQTFAALRAHAQFLAQNPGRRGDLAPEAQADYSRLGEVQTLKLNDSGTEVTRAQTLLRTLGYDVQVTGHFDQMTHDAVQDFQRRYNELNRARLDSDGIIGSATGFAMARSAQDTIESPVSWLTYAQNAARQSGQGASPPVGTAPVPMPNTPPPPSYTGAAPVLRPGSTDRPSVIVLQNQLRALGYQIEPDGSYGPATAAVVADFQRLYSLLTGQVVVADGITGGGTHRAIDDALANGTLNRLPETLRSGRVDIGYDRGTRTPIVTRQTGDGGRLETRAALAYYAMRNDVRSAGGTLTAGESFRTYENQRELWVRYRRYPGRAARPGYSTHQLGIAIDGNDINTTGRTWLTNNARRYGFVLPGYVYGTPGGGTAVEDWHWEYRVDRLPNAARRFYGLPELAQDAVASSPGNSIRRRARRSTRRRSTRRR